MGTIAPELKIKIEALTIEQLEDLGEALLDFATIVDLEDWLAQIGHEPYPRKRLQWDDGDEVNESTILR